MKKQKFTIFVTTFLFIAAAVTVNAQTCPPLTAGCPDTTFGSGGTSVTSINGLSGVGGLTKTIIQSDGKILDLRDVHLKGMSGVTNILMRYNADGSVDYGFGSGGIVYMNWNSPSNAFGNAYDIAFQSIGGAEKIVIAGSGYGGSSTLRVDRYNPDGSPDPAFGSNGSAFFNAGYALAVAVQTDGKILTAGDTGSLVRLNAGGTLDTSFGTGGIVSMPIRGWQFAVQPNGRIVVGGGPNAGRNSITVARFNVNGSLDDDSRKDSTPGDSFGASGKTSIDFFPNGYSSSLKLSSGLQIDADGRIIVGGIAWRSSGDTNKDFAAARLTTGGKLDATFDGDGKTTFDLSGTADTLRGAALQSDGKILLSGLANAQVSNNQNMALIRLNSNGSLDSSFGAGGIRINDISSESEGNYLGTVQFDPGCLCEKIVVTGQVQFGGVFYAFAARYLE
jgi:uncharacterized delta-60 repeat protein